MAKGFVTDGWRSFRVEPERSDADAPPPFSSLPRRPSPPLFPRQSCSKCRCVYYCGRDCQTDAWKDHKRECHTKGEPLKEPLYSNVHGVD